MSLFGAYQKYFRIFRLIKDSSLHLFYGVTEDKVVLQECGGCQVHKIFDMLYILLLFVLDMNIIAFVYLSVFAQRTSIS